MGEEWGTGLMEWASLQLWADDEEKRIHNCLKEALQQLIASQLAKPDDGELTISGKLRPFLYRAKKNLNVLWTIHCEASSFAYEDSEKPYGHPDIRFSYNTPNLDQYDYDIECKLVRTIRTGKRWDYCQHYVLDGVKRFQERKYAQSSPSMGAMIGYFQEGEFDLILGMVNYANRESELELLQLQNEFIEEGITHLTQNVQRATDNCFLTHFWADLR